MVLYNLNRFHAVVFITWQFALIFALQNLFPIFSNFVPRWRCAAKNFTNELTNDCEVFERCPKEFLHFEEVFYSTALEFGWICTESAKFYTWALSTLQFFGVFVGTTIFGSLADKFGRKPMSIIVLSFGILMLAISALSFEWWQFFIARFLVGIANGGTLVVMYPYCMELVEPEQRMALEVYPNWGSARVILTLVCYFFPNWRYASYVSCLTSLPALLIVIFVFPESPMWLLTRNKFEKMKKSKEQIRKISRQDFVEAPTMEEQEKVHLSSLFGNKKILIVFLNLCFSWFTVSCSAFAIDLNSPTLNGSFFMNQFMFACCLACSKFALGIFDYLVPSFNRRMLHNYNQIIAATCFGVVAVLMILGHESIVVLIMSIIGLMAVEYTWDACYLATIEAMPTGIRSTVLGITSTMARIGALVAPLLVTISTFWKPAVYVIITVLGLVNFNLAWNFLPDTKDVNLAEVNLKQGSKVEPNVETP